MTSKTNNTILLERMSSVCADKSSLKARLAMLSLFGGSKSSVLLDQILLFIEYLQLLSPILLFAIYFQKETEESLPSTMLFLAKLINPGLWISFAEVSGFKIFFLILLGAMTFSKYLLFGWIIYKLRKGFEPGILITRAWKCLFSVQGRVLYFYMTFFWVNFAMASALSENETDTGRVLLSLFIMAIEVGFTLTVNARYHYFLPIKSFLSRKNNVVELITFAQKVVLQILTIFLSRDSLKGVWVITVVNVIADLIRNFYFFRKLPLYSFKALNYQAMILMGLTSVNFACFVSAIGKSIDADSISLAFFLYIWGITAGLSIKIAREYIKRMFWKVVCDLSLKSPGLLMHRVPAIKELLSLTGAHFEWNEKSTWASLMNRTLNNHVKTLLKVKEEKPADINDKANAKLLFKNYLERLNESFPHNEVIQLYTAQYCLKKFQKYGDAVKTVAYLRQKGSGNVKLNAELLLIQVQNELQERAAETKRQSQIDITSYLQEQSLVFKLQSEILKQAKAQINIYSEVNKEVPDTHIIHENAQIFNTLRNRNIKTIKKSLLNSLSECNLEPLLLYAHYSYVLNHCYEDYTYYLKIYSQRLQKYQRYFDQEDLCQKNIFQNSNGLYFLSGNRANVSQIMFAPKSLGTRCTTIPDSSSRLTISTQIVPCLRGIYAQFYKYAAESNDETFFNKPIRGSIYHEDGYIFEATYHLNIHPYVTQGFYFVLFLRPIISNRETFYVLENGDIDCGTKGISEKLGILSKKESGKVKKNISLVSEELVTINKAFNMIAFPEKYKGVEGLTMEQAKEIYEIFTTTGKEIRISATIDHCTTSYPFHCKAVNKIYGQMVLKNITLIENVKEAQKIINEHTLITSQRNKTHTKISENAYDDDEYSFGNFDENDDEKEQGWINFEPLTFRRSQTPRGDSNTDTARDQEETTSRQLLKTRISNMKTTEFAAPTSTKTARLLPQKTGVFVRRNNNKRQTMITANEKFSEKASSLNESISRASSQKRRIANLFKMWLEYKCSPRIFKGLTTLVYVALIAFLLSQFLISGLVNTNVDSFKAQKDFLRKYQLRIFYLISTQGITRLLHDVRFGLLNVTGLRTFARGIGVYQNLAVEYSTGLLEANQYLLQNADVLKADLSRQLFAEDIPIYYTYFDENPQSFMKQTCFSAIDRILTQSFNVFSYNGTNEEDIKEAAQFVYRNSLNDLLVKIQNLSEILIDFLNDRRSEIQGYVFQYFTAMIIVNILVFLVFIFFLWRQYLKEARNLSAFCRVNGQSLAEVLKGCVTFKEMIEEQRPWSPDLPLGLLHKRRNLEEKQAKREISKEYNHKGLRRKYYIYIGIYMVFLAVLILFVSAAAVITTELLDAFKNEQGQIYFLDSFRSRIALTLQAGRELIATNNAAFVENRSARQETSLLLGKLKDLKTEIYSQLLDEKTVSEIPEVKQMLLGDSCKLITNPAVTFHCALLHQLGIRNGLVYLLGNFEEAMNSYWNAYEASDKSTASLMKIQRVLYNEIPPFFVVPVFGALSLSDIIDAKLERVLEDNYKGRFWFLFGCSAITIVGGVFLWMLILRKLRRGIVEFKNVLKTLPAELVLSSFILKTFLRKTSKTGGFDSSALHG